MWILFRVVPGKLAQEHNSKTALMGMEMYAGDLLTTAQIKEHRQSIPIAYRPTQCTKRSSN